MRGYSNKTIVSVACAISILVSSCATTDSSGRPLSALDRSINQCIGSVVVGAMLGALIGSTTNHGRAGQGALIGAGVGTVACAVFVAMNSAQDKERVRQNEANAAKSGHNVKSSYVGDDGRQRTIETSSEPSLVPASFSSSKPTQTGPAITGPCRKVHTQISVQGAGTAALDAETVCRNADGDYVAVSSGGAV